VVTGAGSTEDAGRLLDVEDSVLCVVDVQPGFLGKLGREEAGRLAARIAWVVVVAARLGVPVVVTEEEPDRNERTIHEVAYRLPPDAPTFTKPVFGLADVPDILGAVKRTDRWTTVLIGLETDVCVAHSALGLLDRGYRVAVVRDATGSPGDAHDAGIDRMRSAGVVVVTAKSLLYEWVRTVERASALEKLMVDAPPPEDLVL
jgi:nicotinamidase-related amidase